MAKYLDYSGLQYLWTKIKNYVSTQPLGANVRYDAQTLTTAQQAQARKNIAAGGSNPNLLDNAYFVGGGSQLGDGICPINQRGQTSYTGATYTIDRWIIASSSIYVTLNAGYLELSGTAGSNFSQVMDPNLAKALYGKTVTASALMYDGTIISGTNVFPAANTSGWNFVGFVYGTDAALIVGTNQAGRSEFFIQTQSASAKVKAVKLELGTVSTLANDPPPDFGEELRKCQRYLRYVSLKRLPVFCDANYLVAMTTLEGIEMRATPTPSLVSAGYIFNPATSATSVPTAVSILAFEYNTVTIQLSIPASFNGSCIAVDSAICLSAEL